MADHDRTSWRAFIEGLGPAPAPTLPADDFAMASLERHKHEGMILAVRARFLALGVIAIMLPIINFRWEMIYYEILLIGFILNGWAQMKVATVGQSRAEIFFLFIDLILMAVVVMVPNPLAPVDWPLEMQFRFHTHQYFYVFLAFGTLAYSWRTVRGYGTMTAIVWALGVSIIWLSAPEDRPLTDAIAAAFPNDPRMIETLDPQNIRFDVRLQEVVVFILVALILSITVRRFGDLLLGHAALERERTNLARYFSPNVVEELSHNDEPLKQVRTQDVAVLFVDIVGFTAYSADRSPEEVIQTLREFHRRMAEEVFRHNGTLDKFLGDGLMATFGTPVAGPEDAANALTCARAMSAAMRTWNDDRAKVGEPEIRASFGLHFGPAVLGDVGDENRMEFAVIGNTVNIASRVEALTRNLGVQIAMTEEMEQAVQRCATDRDCLDGFTRFEAQEIRGLEDRVTILGAA